jgi:hypothetical protein
MCAEHRAALAGGHQNIEQRLVPPQSTISAFSSLIDLAETSLIVSPSTTNSWPPYNSPAAGSSISKFLKWYTSITWFPAARAVTKNVLRRFAGVNR